MSTKEFWSLGANSSFPSFPAAFYADDNNTLWIIENKVAIFNINHANIVFYYGIPGLQVYGIKETEARLLGSLYDAMEFFKET